MNSSELARYKGQEDALLDTYCALKALRDLMVSGNPEWDEVQVDAQGLAFLLGCLTERIKAVI